MCVCVCVCVFSRWHLACNARAQYCHLRPDPLCNIFPHVSQKAIAQWLRCCATNRKVAGSIPAGIIQIFHLHNPSDRTMALGSTQPLIEMSTRGISLGVKAAGA